MTQGLLWAAMAGYAAVVFVAAPGARDHAGFLWARGERGDAPSSALLTASVVVSWIFAKSITNAANLGEKYGIVGGLAYATWYLAIPVAGLLVYRIRKAGHEGIIPFLTARFGTGSALLFSLLILVRLFNEIWSNTSVVASYFGAPGSFAYYASALAFTASVLAYVLRGGLRASIFTDRLQAALAVVLLAWIVEMVMPAHGVAAIASTGTFSLAGGVDLILVALLQVTSYPFHDPVLTDRAFVIPPRKMLAAYVIAGAIGGAFIVLYSTLGIHARLSGLSGAGDAPVRVASAVGPLALVVVTVLMMNSAGACLDSAFSAIARHVAVDLAGEGGEHPGGFPGLSATLRARASRDRGLALGRWSMVAFAAIGNLPIFWHADILKATTISGTMVLGLAPAFLLWKLHRPAPLAFLFAVLVSLSVGIFAVVGRWPEAMRIGHGDSAALLGQNLYGLIACVIAYGLGVAIDSVRPRPAA